MPRPPIQTRASVRYSSDSTLLKLHKQLRKVRSGHPQHSLAVLKRAVQGKENGDLLMAAGHFHTYILRAGPHAAQDSMMLQIGHTGTCAYLLSENQSSR